MYILSLQLKNYRNYESLEISFHEGINIFYGDNAQGKTNILESVYLCGTNKSHRGSNDKEMVAFGEEESHIKLMVDKNEMEYRIDMHLRRNKSKGIAVNGLPIRKASELFGIVNMVFFSPEDLQIIKNGPAERRRFIDLELCQLDRLYIHHLVNYNRCLKQRNLLLKDISFHSKDADTLEIWDEQMIQHGTKLIMLRRLFLRELQPVIGDIHGHLTGGLEHLSVSYEPNISEEEFKDALVRNRDRDLKQKLTLTGPHRDDIRFSIDGIDIRIYGSQGQQRTAALSLKLSEIELVKQKANHTPILLLDDVLSELDSGRQQYLLNSIHGIQTMITCTGLDDFVGNRFHMDKVFKVTSGMVSEEN